MGRYDIFISYRRRPGFPLAKYLRDHLTLLGYRAFLDVDALNPGKQFDSQLEENIANCRDFILVMAPESLDGCSDKNDWVRKELLCALEHKKNIIPVRYGDFHFPLDFPEELFEIRRKEAISFPKEYFHPAFRKLTQALSRKPLPTLLLWRILPCLLALLLVVLAVFGWKSLQPTFPRNRREEGILEESLAYSVLNLQQANQAFELYDRTLKGAQDYCQGIAGAPNRSALLENIDYAQSQIEVLGNHVTALDASLREKLRTTPEISAAEVDSMTYCIRLDIDGMLDNLKYLRQIFTEFGYRNDSNANIIDCYQQSAALAEESYFVALNQTFVQANTSSTPMRNFLGEQLPLLYTLYDVEGTRIWNTDANILKSQEEAIYNKQQAVVNRLASLVGNERQELDALTFAIVKAQAIIKTITPQDGDTFYDNWTDMLFALGYQRTDLAEINLNEARKNIAALETPEERNEADKALDSALLWIDQHDNFPYASGCVIFYFNEDGAEYSHLRPGDILVMLDGKSVASSSDFIEAWQQVTTPSWDYTILRADEHGVLREAIVTVVKGEEHFDGHILPLRPITFEEYMNE